MIIVKAAVTRQGKMAEKKLPDILDHYVLPSMEALDGIFRAKCRHCHKSISGTTKVTTNWLKHMVSTLANIMLNYI